MNDTVSEANVSRFNAIADSWDDNPIRTALARGVAGAILERIAPTGEERAMEFGAGTGLVTALLAPRLGRVLAVDSAGGMLDVLRDKAAGLGLDNIEVREADLSRDMPAGPFDLVFSSMTLHHIQDVAGLLARLAGVLAPGGRIAVADLETEDGTFHGDTPGVAHQGFDPAVVAEWLAGAGFEEVQVAPAHVVHKTGADDAAHDYPVFLATARLPRKGVGDK
ncbi:MAG TPA: class I SAM-dependent methyltransferase [Gammaproteobacteria bacterium]|nr:class I SAM-dependent methyltransferase [Gammaproteobacteria bacterium]